MSPLNVSPQPHARRVPRPSPPLPSQHPQVLHCSTPADFLAALPHLIGFTASESLFIVFFSGKRAAQSARFDLPRGEDPVQFAQVSEFVCELMVELGAGNGSAAPALVISTEQSFSTAREAPWLSFARTLQHQLSRNGVAPREFCCVASDGWASYLEQPMPSHGRPLSEIADSHIALEAAQFGSGLPPKLSDLGRIPDSPPSRTAEVATRLAAVSKLRPGDAPPQEPNCHSHPHTSTAEAAMASLVSSRALSADLIAALAHFASQAEPWLQMFAELCASHGRTAERVREHGAGNSSDSLKHEVTAQDPSLLLMRLRAISLAAVEELDLVPLRERLLQSISLTPESHRPGLYLISAWAWWLSGIQSVAKRHAAAAAAASAGDPHPLYAVLQQLIEIPFPLQRMRSNTSPVTTPPAFCLERA